MKIAATILTLGAAALAACGPAAEQARPAQPPAPTRQVLFATATSANGPSITVVGNGTVAGTPDEGTMTFSVSVNSGSAASALAGESSRAQKLIEALKAAGVAAKDVQTAWVSLYRNEQTALFTASSSVTAKILGISSIGRTIDAAVAAAGDSVSLGGIALSIADTSALMASARAAAIHDAQSKAQQYAQAAGMKLGGIVSISEADNAPRPVYYGRGAAAQASSLEQPVEPGQQQLQVSVTVVFALQ